MEAYTDFAGVYDIFMDDTPYEEWFAFLKKLIEEYGISRPEGKASAGQNPEDEQIQEAEQPAENGQLPEDELEDLADLEDLEDLE